MDWDQSTASCLVGGWVDKNELLVPRLVEDFTTVLRTDRYTHELVVTPTAIDGPNALPYPTLKKARAPWLWGLLDGGACISVLVASDCVGVAFAATAASSAADRLREEGRGLLEFEGGRVD